MLYTFIKSKQSYPHRKLWDCVTECVEIKVVKFVIQLCNISAVGTYNEQME